MRLRTGTAILLTSVATTVLSQTAGPASSPTGLEILEKVSRHYSEAKSYHIERTQETITTNDYQRNWQKELAIAEEAPNGRRHFEGRSPYGFLLRISDGKTVWVYHVTSNTYTQKTSEADALDVGGPISASEMGLVQAEQLRDDLATIAKGYNSADRLPDADLVLQGRKVPCYVVRLKSEDLNKKLNFGASDITYWIDKANNVVLQSEEHSHTQMHTGTDNIPIEMETKATYTLTQLDFDPPSEHFTFNPPAEAKLVPSFPNLLIAGSMGFTGRQLPSITVKSAEGNKVSLDSFRGKPMLIDIWATWCAPCIKNMPQLAQLYKEAIGKGIVSITIDRGDEANVARDFLKGKGYDWQNFHDEGDATTALGEYAVPRTLIIDKQGKIVFDKIGSATDEQLRKELAKLDPEYSSLAPKQNVNCEAAK